MREQDQCLLVGDGRHFRILPRGLPRVPLSLSVLWRARACGDEGLLLGPMCVLHAILKSILSRYISRFPRVQHVREILGNQQEITTLTVIWARQLVSPQPKLVSFSMCHVCTLAALTLVSVPVRSF